MSSEPPSCRSSPPLWSSHQPQSVSDFKTACMQPSSHMTCVRSGPYSTTATYLPTSHQHRQLYYLLASTQWETWATSSWDQQRKWMSQFWISQKCRGKKPAPSHREREGKSGRSLNHLECCLNHWKLVIGLYFTFHQRNRLHVSYPFLNCKWQPQLFM